MKKLVITFTFFLAIIITSQAQFKNVLKEVGKKDSVKTNISSILKKGGSGLSSEEIIGGLKEALTVGTDNGSKKLSAVDGFFKDAAIKILMPAEAQKAEKTLRSFGMGKFVDDAILSMNRAAEDAAKSASPIFINAIKQITIQDGIGILRGGDHAATEYLKSKTVLSLTEAFRPIVELSLQNVGATKHWNTVFSNYNKISTDKINPDLTAYVTEKALAGIFYQVAQEEQKIRKDPAARTSDLLKKVFN